MEIKFWIEDRYKKPLILLCNNELNDEMRELQKKVSLAVSGDMVGYTQKGSQIISILDIIRIYTEGQKIYAQTDRDIVMLKMRLYQLEGELTDKDFIRISNSELVNIHKIRKLDTSFSGTIRMELSGNIETFVSRRNVAKIKKALGI